jgi:DNA-binding beta-propeller fold protein YncE
MTTPSSAIDSVLREHRVLSPPAARMWLAVFACLGVAPVWSGLHAAPIPDPQQQELTASDGATGDYFGSSVAVSGDTAIIGAPHTGFVGGISDILPGSAYVFVRNGSGTWTQVQELTASDGLPEDGFGAAVAMSGTTAMIAGHAKGLGAVYVFERNGSGTWTQVQELTASDGVAGDNFGKSVSVSGNTAVIGDPFKNSYEGAVYVFVRDPSGTWSQVQELTAADGVAGSSDTGDLFGWSVSVSGSTAVVGAWQKDSRQGAAYVFVGLSSGTWIQQQKLTAADGTWGDSFGTSVSISAATAVIGAPGGNLGEGVAYVFVRHGTSWAELPVDLDQSDMAAGDQFGGSVSVSGNTAVLSAPGKSDDKGSAYIFTHASGSEEWNQVQEFTASDGASGDYFGNSVSVDAATILIGAPTKNTFHGAAYVFAGPSPALVFGSAAGSSSVAVNYSGSWTATANASFLHISAGSASGTGSGVVAFTYDAFNGTGSRTGTLTVAGGTVTVTQAGTNYAGPAGEVTLVSSGLNGPSGVAVDVGGNVYFADAGNNSIQEWNALTQQVTTLVWTGLSKPSGVAVDGSSGNVYFSDSGNNAIKEWNASTQQVTTLVSTGLSNPSGVAVDGFGNLYFADSGNNAIKEWNASTQQVTTLVATGLSNPSGVAVDGAGNLYFADSGNNAVKEWSASTQQVTTLVSTGLSNPSGVGVDRTSGNVYFADSGNHAIKEWNASTKQVTTRVSIGLNAPSGVAVGGSSVGNLYFADAGNNEIIGIFSGWVGPATVTEPASAASDLLYPVLPATGIPAATSDQSWLSIQSIANGVISFSFTANTSTSARVAHISLLGQQIAVTQNPASSVIFAASPNPIPSGATTTLSWNAPGYSQLAILVGSSSGSSLASPVGSSGSVTTGDWVTDGMEFFLVDLTNGATIAIVTVHLSPGGGTTPSAVSFTANPNPIPAPGQPTTLTWNAPGYSNLAIRVNSPTGTTLAGGLGSSGSTVTGTWVTNGMTFFLVDTTSGVTVASVTVNVGPAVSDVQPAVRGMRVFTASPNPLPAPGQPVTFTWSAPEFQYVTIHLYSPTGPALTGITGSSGSVVTGNQITSDTQFFLVDLASGTSIASVWVYVGHEFIATPNPIPPGQPTTLTWNAPGYSSLKIHVNSPTGQALTGTVGSSGSAVTGNWVTDGMQFFLVDVTSGTTVASVVVHVGAVYSTFPVR